MSDARSLTALTESDYDAIAAAVMETARGRWFMAEFAKRNRQADTTQLLTAIARIERAVGAATPQPAVNDSSLREASALIMDLRSDLERISGHAEGSSSGLAGRMEGAAASIIAATEGIQEAAWTLREAGADSAQCDRLDRRATEIYAAAAVVEGGAQRIGKIADTIAMLDSSLRAFGEGEIEDVGFAPSEPPGPVVELGLRPAGPLSSYDVDVVENPLAAHSVLEPEPTPAHRRVPTSAILDDDLDFVEPEPNPAPAAKPAVIPVASMSEADLRALDAMPTSEKLAYFA